MLTKKSNESEIKFIEKAISMGWEVTKKGYPDFICWKQDGREIDLLLVEVKKYKKQRLSPEQRRFAKFIKKFKIPFRVWSPDNDWLNMPYLDELYKELKKAKTTPKMIDLLEFYRDNILPSKKNKSDKTAT